MIKRRRSLNRDLVISDFIGVYGNKYDYNLVKYKTMHDKVDIICKEHGLFKQTPNSHYRGRGCPKYSNRKTGIYYYR